MLIVFIAKGEKAKAKKFEEAQSIIRERIALIDASRFRGPDIMAFVIQKKNRREEKIKRLMIDD